MDKASGLRGSGHVFELSRELVLDGDLVGTLSGESAQCRIFNFNFMNLKGTFLHTTLFFF